MSSKKNIRKAALSTIAASAAVVSISPVVSAAKTDAPFSDVTPAKVGVHYDAIVALSKQGVINGQKDGTFAPFESVKRSQVALMLQRAKDLKVPANKAEELKKYKDVNPNDSIADAVAAVSAAGVFTGSNGQFQPWANMSREQMATVLVRAFELEKYDKGSDVKVNLSNVSDAHKKNVQVLANLGITTELKDFKPSETISRAQFSTFVYRTQQLTADKEAPVIKVEGEQAINVKYGAKLELPKVTVTDNMDKEVKLESVIKDGNDKTVDMIDTKKPGIYTITYSAEDKAGNKAREVSIKVVVAEEGLNVEGISKINADGVTLMVEPTNKDRFDQTIIVKDNDGNLVPVKPATIAAGDREVTFEFMKKAENQKGVWEVAGLKYDSDLAANVNAFVNADSQLALNKALSNLKIANVKTENIAAYVKDRPAFIDNLIKENKEVTVERIQAFVNSVNDEVANSSQSAAIAKTVNDAITAGNDVAFKNALNDKAFARVNNDWLIDGYKAAIKDKNANTVKDIQKLINQVNDEKVKTAAAGLDNQVDVQKLSEAKALISTYATPDSEGKQTETTKNALHKVDVQMAVADVAKAPTPTTLEQRIQKLADLVNTDKVTKIDLKQYKVANGKAYLEKIKDVKSPEDVNNAIINGNAAVNEGSLTAVKEAAGKDADKLLEALKAYPGIKNVADSNKEAYINGGFASVTAENIQEKVDAQNIKAVQQADTTDKLLTALKVLNVKAVTDANKELYFGNSNSNFNVVNGATNEDKLVSIQNKLDELNTQAGKEAALKTINDATTATGVKDGLDQLAFPAYLNVTSVDKLHIAEKLMDARPKDGFADSEAIRKALYVPKTATTPAAGIIAEYTDTLNAINTNLKKTTSNTDTINILKTADNKVFNEMTLAKQSTTAENFRKNAEYQADGTTLKPFGSLKAVNEAIEAAAK